MKFSNHYRCALLVLGMGALARLTVAQALLILPPTGNPLNVCTVTFAYGPPPGVGWFALMSSAPVGFYWTQTGIGAAYSGMGITYLGRYAWHTEPLVRPVSVSWTITETFNNVPTAYSGSGSMTQMSDIRTPEQLAESAKFDTNVYYIKQGDNFVVYGNTTNVTYTPPQAQPTLEYWNGSAWMPVVSGGFGPNTNRFIARFPATGGIPLIRVYRAGQTPAQMGWTVASAPPVMDYGAVRATIRMPSGPPNRFKIKQQTATMGVRG